MGFANLNYFLIHLESLQQVLGGRNPSIVQLVSATYMVVCYFPSANVEIWPGSIPQDHHGTSYQ